MAVRSRRLRLDLNSPEFQDVFFRLELSELKQVVGSLRRLGGDFLRIISLHPDHDSAYER